MTRSVYTEAVISTTGKNKYKCSGPLTFKNQRWTAEYLSNKKLL